MNRPFLTFFILLFVGLPVYAQNPLVKKALNKSNKKISLDFLKRPIKYTKGLAIKDEIFKLAKQKYKGLKFLDFKKWYASNFFYSTQQMVNVNLNKVSTILHFLKGTIKMEIVLFRDT